MTSPVEADMALAPVAICLLDSRAVVVGPQGFREAIEELGLSRRRTGLRSQRGVPRTRSDLLGRSASQGAQRSPSRSLRRPRVIRLVIPRRPHAGGLLWAVRRTVDAVISSSAVRQQLSHRHPEILRDFAEQDRRNISPEMERHRRPPTVWMPELLMAAPLPRLMEPETFEDGHDLRWFKDGHVPQG